MRSSWRLVLTTFVFVVGCDEQPTELSSRPTLATPAFTIVDAAHGGSAPFYFLPPMVPAPTYTGTFDGTQTPTVRVCQLSGTACSLTSATWTGAQVKVDPVAEAYMVMWKTKDAGLDPRKTYRIEVALGAQLLGYADVVVLSNGSQINTVDKNQFVATINGVTLPIRFRIERATPPPPPPPPSCTPGALGCGWQNGDMISYPQVSWGDPLQLGGAQVITNYDAVYAPFGFVAIGFVPFSMTFTSLLAVLTYLPATGPAAPLNANLVDPTSSASGVFGGEVLALRLNIDFSDAGFSLGTSGIRFGDLTLCAFTGSLAGLNGISMRDFSDIIVNTALGGGATPYTITDLNTTAFEINGSFGGGVPSTFAQQHLFNGACDGSGWKIGEVISHSQLSWGQTVFPGGALIAANYDAVYASTAGQIEVGIPGASGFSIIFTSTGAVLAYLPSTGVGAALNADHVDPLSSAAGIFGGEVLALRFNIDFTDAGHALGTSGLRFGDLTLCAFTGSLAALNGMSIRTFSSIVNTAFGGGSTPYTIADLNSTTSFINDAFNNGVPITFAQQHLSKSACP